MELWSLGVHPYLNNNGSPRPNGPAYQVWSKLSWAVLSEEMSKLEQDRPTDDGQIAVAKAQL